MGVHCRTLGHAYESTDFEQDREERAEGTVLICREYRVCSRCGHREELYHNERLIDPAAASDPSPSESEPQPTTDDTPTDIPASTESPDESTPEPAPSTTATSATTARSGTGDQSTDDTPSVESSTEPPEADRSQPDDSPRSTPENARQTPSSVDSADDSTDTDAPTPAASAADESEVPPEDPEDDDAVILTETTARATDGGSAVTHPAEDAWRNDQTTAEQADTTSDQLGCSACDTTWTRTETPLREGDLCPACHAAYLKRR